MERLDLLIAAYAVLADFNNQWPGRSFVSGQRLLCDMRDTISEQTGFTDEYVHDSAPVWLSNTIKP